jgi:hypothetical protein
VEERRNAYRILVGKPEQKVIIWFILPREICETFSSGSVMSFVVNIGLRVQQKPRNVLITVRQYILKRAETQWRYSCCAQIREIRLTCAEAWKYVGFRYWWGKYRKKAWLTYILTYKQRHMRIMKCDNNTQETHDKTLTSFPDVIIIDMTSWYRMREGEGTASACESDIRVKLGRSFTVLPSVSSDVHLDNLRLVRHRFTISSQYCPTGDIRL